MAWSALKIVGIGAMVIAAGAAAAGLSGKAVDGDWPTFNHDLAGTRYSPLTQINAKNVSTLKVAWTYRLRTDAERGKPVAGFTFSQVTPLVVNGMMYLMAGNRVLALEPETGRELWRHVVEEVAEKEEVSHRGVSYWPGDLQNPPRIFFTAGSRLFAVDAKTGQSEPGFGAEGVVDLGVPYNAPPTIYGNLVIVGANVPEHPGKGPAGDTRAYDARTGAKAWEFHSVPRPGEVGHETWAGDSWKERTGVNNWGFYMTVDAARGILYTVFGSPASDFFGADRKGNNLFGNSVVALDAATGRYKWHFQAVHHDLWDYDLPPAPVLLDVTVKGRKIPVLAQTGKVGYMYILNRVTGEPVFGIEEKPVPPSLVPGEQSSPTQPIPVKPPELSRHQYVADDLVTAADTNEAHANACRELVRKSGGALYNAGPYTPWVYRAAGAPPVSSVIFPGPIGGTDWGGQSADPKLGYVFLNVSEYGALGWVEKMPADSPVPYDQRSVWGVPIASKFWDRKTDAKGDLLGASSWPCNRPPWGHLLAVNIATGEIAWKVRLGVTDELPEGKKETGRLNLGGSIATAGGLVFIGATNDRRFRAFDSKTGTELWVTRLEYSAISVPMTYQGRNGKQYVAVTAAGGGAITDPNPNDTESLYVFALR
jgi:quinoprotein glucose dehydrogenase